MKCRSSEFGHGVCLISMSRTFIITVQGFLFTAIKGVQRDTLLKVAYTTLYFDEVSGA